MLIRLLAVLVAQLAAGGALISGSTAGAAQLCYSASPLLSNQIPAGYVVTYAVEQSRPSRWKFCTECELPRLLVASPQCWPLEWLYHVCFMPKRVAEFYLYKFYPHTRIGVLRLGRHKSSWSNEVWLGYA